MKTHISMFSLALLVAPLARRAESAQRLGVIEGIVTDTGLAPIPSAEVVVVSSAIAMRTGPNGVFRLPGLSPGSHILIVRRIGFFPASMILRLSDSDTVHVSFALKRAAQEIEVVTVMGERGQSLRLMEFEYRRRFGKGRYRGRREIDWHRGSSTADLLRLLGMRLVRLPADDGRPCGGRVFLNGVALPAPVDPDDLPAPPELAGIEVYKGVPPPIPLQYGGMSACGNVIMLWTTDGS
jgi:hypothetical protein